MIAESADMVIESSVPLPLLIAAAGTGFVLGMLIQIFIAVLARTVQELTRRLGEAGPGRRGRYSRPRLRIRLYHGNRRAPRDRDRPAPRHTRPAHRQAHA